MRFRRDRFELEGDRFVFGGEVPSHEFEFALHRHRDGVGEFLAVLLAQFDLPSRLRIRIRAAAGPEHRDRAGKGFFDSDLRVPRVVAAPLQTVESRVVTRVTEHDRFRFVVLPRDDQDRNRVIDGTAGVLAIDNAFLRRLAPVHRESRFTVCELQRRGFEVLHGRADEFDQIGLEFPGVCVDFVGLVRGESVHIDEVLAHDRAAVRVRRGQHQFLPLDAEPLFDLGGDIDREVSRNADQVGRHENEPLAGRVFEADGFRVKLVQLPLGGFGARRVAGHPHRLLGSDDLRRDSGLERRRGLRRYVCCH